MCQEYLLQFIFIWLNDNFRVGRNLLTFCVEFPALFRSLSLYWQDKFRTVDLDVFLDFESSGAKHNLLLHYTAELPPWLSTSLGRSSLILTSSLCFILLWITPTSPTRELTLVCVKWNRCRSQSFVHANVDLVEKMMVCQQVPSVTASDGNSFHSKGVLKYWSILWLVLYQDILQIFRIFGKMFNELLKVVENWTIPGQVQHDSA